MPAGIGSRPCWRWRRRRPASPKPETFAATAENITNARDSIQIVLRRWSTDAERDQFLAAWNVPAAPVSIAPAAPAPAADAPQQGRGGRGGRGRGAGAAPPPRMTPESSLAKALLAAPTVGDLWSSSESIGYSLCYAVRLPEPGGGERVILITDRRLGESGNAWKPAGATAPANYEFSLIELRVNAKGEGEGKASLTGKVVIDSAAKT